MRKTHSTQTLFAKTLPDSKHRQLPHSSYRHQIGTERHDKRHSPFAAGYIRR
ncbi:hypothetical protein [Alloprevotella tannerae]|uniref:hypothetical protein n=1 Tax=Alloprevotella tannerae TaxID=76122 RepID=UPI0028D67DD1|nr:hypothetical protein [Alloprevotella tannerae]